MDHRLHVDYLAKFSVPNSHDIASFDSSLKGFEIACHALLHYDHFLSAVASFGAAPQRLRRIESRKYSVVEARIFLPMAVSQSTSCPFGQGVGGQAQAQVRSAASQSHDNFVNRRVAMPRGIGVSFEVGMGVSRSHDWRSMHLGPGHPR